MKINEQLMTRQQNSMEKNMDFKVMFLETTGATDPWEAQSKSLFSLL
jgi:hypothetical protein